MIGNSMINPPILSLLERVDNRYALVVITAKRARQLVDNAKPMLEIDSTKPVTVAVNEIYEGLIEYETVKIGIK